MKLFRVSIARTSEPAPGAPDSVYVTASSAQAALTAVVSDLDQRAAKVVAWNVELVSATVISGA